MASFIEMPFVAVCKILMPEDCSKLFSYLGISCATKKLKKRSYVIGIF
jgi:hypothetical protein